MEYIGEWLQARFRIPNAEYAALAEQFNPTAFDAEEIVRRFRDAGIRYVVFTAKHHDGFAMYHSRVSRFNIVDATPFRRDPAASSGCGSASTTPIASTGMRRTAAIPARMRRRTRGCHGGTTGISPTGRQRISTRTSERRRFRSSPNCSAGTGRFHCSGSTARSRSGRNTRWRSALSSINFNLNA